MKKISHVMLRQLSIGVLLFLMCLSSGYSQSPDLLDSLVQMKFINDQGKDELRKRLERKIDNAENLDVLRFLIDVNHVQSKIASYEDKKYSKKLREIQYDSFESIYPRIYLEEFEFDLSPPLRSLEGDQNRTILQELYTLKLISEETRLRCLNLISNGQITLEIELFNVVFSEQRFVQSYNEMQKREHAFAKDLLELGLIDQASYQKVILECQNYKLLGFPEIAAYSKMSKMLQFDENESNFVLCYSDSFNQMIELIPDFKADSISFSLVEYPFMLGLLEQYIDTYIMIDSLAYRSQVYHAMRHHKRRKQKKFDSDQACLRVNLSFRKVLNSYLNASKSPFQIHHVKGFNKDSTSITDEKVVIKLTHDQSEVLSPYRSVSKEDYKELESTIDLKFEMNRLDSLGLLNHLSEAEIDGVFALLKDNEVSSVGQVLEVIPRTIGRIKFLERNSNTPYVDLTKELFDLTRGVVQVKDISDNFIETVDSKRPVRLTVSLSSGKWFYDFKNGKESVDPDYSWFLGFLVKKNGIWKGQFYQTYKNAEKNGIIFLTNDQFYAFQVMYPDYLLTKINPGLW